MNVPKLPEIGAVVFAHLKRPRAIACTAFLALGAAIATNALFLQPRPHPAPLFATRAPVRRPTETGDPLVRDNPGGALRARVAIPAPSTG